MEIYNRNGNLEIKLQSFQPIEPTQIMSPSTIPTNADEADLLQGQGHHLADSLYGQA